MDINKLRSDFLLVRARMVDFEEWTGEQAAEIRAHIGDLVTTGEAEDLAFWAEWMANMADVARSHRAAMAEIERKAAWWAMEMRRAA